MEAADERRIVQRGLLGMSSLMPLLARVVDHHVDRLSIVRSSESPCFFSLSASVNTSADQCTQEPQVVRVVVGNDVVTVAGVAIRPDRRALANTVRTPVRPEPVDPTGRWPCRGASLSFCTTTPRLLIGGSTRLGDFSGPSASR